jgi:hypothetical protein
LVSPLPGRERARVRVEALPAAHDLSAIALPANPASFKAACDVIAAVRKAKTEAGLSLAAPVEEIQIATYKYGAGAIAVVLGDVASASGTSAAKITVSEGRDKPETPVVAVITVLGP